MKNSLSSGDRYEDMLDMVQKICALGRIVSDLSYAMKNGALALELFGEDLGNIITDYATTVLTELENGKALIDKTPEEYMIAKKHHLKELKEKKKKLESSGLSSQAVLQVLLAEEMENDEALIDKTLGDYMFMLAKKHGVKKGPDSEK